MKRFFKNNNSDKLVLFFAGWGCDEYQFGHLSCNDDLLILFDYNDLELNFDFSLYKEIVVLAYSAGVFISSIFPQNIPNVQKRIMIDGNPYLFDTHYGLPKEIVDMFKEVDEDNCPNFRKDYLVMTDKEYDRFCQNEPKRSIESCLDELKCLEGLYEKYKSQITPKFDFAIVGDNDPLFNPKAQAEFYKEKLILLNNAKHNPFFRFDSFEDIINLTKPQQ